MVDQAEPGTPAAEAGLKSGDVITKLNGQEIKDAADLTRHVGAMKPGDKAEIAYLRDGTEKTANLTLASQKSEQTAKADDVAERARADARRASWPPPTRSPAPATRASRSSRSIPTAWRPSKGLASGDVILDVAGKAVSQPAEVKADIAAAKQDGKKAVLMRVKTAEGARFVAFELPKA